MAQQSPQILPQKMASVVKKEVNNIDLGNEFTSIFNSVKKGVKTGVQTAVKAGRPNYKIGDNSDFKE